MQAGRLIHRVNIQQPTILAGDTGESEYTYADADPAVVVWARVEYSSQSKTSEGIIQASGQATYNVLMRYRTDITYRTRLVWKSRTLMVTGISEDPKSIETIIECEEANL